MKLWSSITSQLSQARKAFFPTDNEIQQALDKAKLSVIPLQAEINDLFASRGLNEVKVEVREETILDSMSTPTLPCFALTGTVPLGQLKTFRQSIADVKQLITATVSRRFTNLHFSEVIDGNQNLRLVPHQKISSAMYAGA